MTKVKKSDPFAAQEALLGNGAEAGYEKRRFIGAKVIKWIVFAIFALYAFSLLMPFLWMLNNSFKAAGEFSGGNRFGLPKQFTFQNYVTVFGREVNGSSIASMFLRSVLLTALGTFINVMLSAMSAYVVAKYQFPGRRIVFLFALISMTVPIVGTLPAQIRMMEMLNFDGSMLGVLFLYSGCFGFNFILLHGAFSTIPWTYAEAVELDGGGRFTIFFRIMLPVARGPIVAVAILQAIAFWSDYSTPFLYMEQPTLAVGLQGLEQAFKGDFPAIFTTVMIAVVPMVILYACFQKTILKNTMAGGLKG